MILAFRARVYADNGVFEAPACLAAQLEELRKDQLLSSASFLVTPNAVEENKLFAIVPSSGAGDLDVVRATTATRVNSDGLIEQVPYNLATYSEDFSNVIWSKVATTITTNSVNAPNGTLTADTFIANGTTSAKLITGGFSVTLGTTYSISVFVKKNTNNFVQLIGASGTFGSNVWANFDLNNGVIGTIGSSATATITDFGNDWYRCVIVGTATASTTPAFSIGLITSATSARAESNTLSTSVYLWGAQLVTGTSAKEYFPTTDRLDVPRLDYTNSTCPSILVEPQRTNLVTYSEDFSNAAWVKDAGVTVTPNSIISPSGIQNADLIQFSAGNKEIKQTISSTTGGTASIYIKGTAGQTIKFGVAGDDSIYTLNGEWQRLTKVFTITTTRITINTYTSVTARDIYVWGAQLEAGSNATSYIPTVASSVTRNLDVFSTTNLISKGLIVNDYTLFLDITNPSLGSQYILDPRDISNIRTGILRVSGTNATLSDITGGSTLTMLNALTLGKAKMCAKRTGNVISFFTNGVKFASTTTTTAGTINNLQTGVGNSANSSFINSIILFPTALTDAECIALTTL